MSAKAHDNKCICSVWKLTINSLNLLKINTVQIKGIGSESDTLQRAILWICLARSLCPTAGQDLHSNPSFHFPFPSLSIWIAMQIGIKKKNNNAVWGREVKEEGRGWHSGSVNSCDTSLNHHNEITMQFMQNVMQDGLIEDLTHPQTQSPKDPGGAGAPEASSGERKSANNPNFPFVLQLRGICSMLGSPSPDE